MTDKGNILIVDDTPANLHLLTNMLAEQQYKVRPVPNGTLALRAVKSALPDLILLDINMPGLNGFEVCQRLKADEATREIPVIFLSALHETVDKVRAFEVGAVDYVTKPFQLEEVLARIQTHLSLRHLQKQLQESNEALRQQTAELEARNEELDAFAGTVAHDLRGPLTPIIGMADILGKYYASSLDERGQRIVARISTSGHRMADIIQALLLLARLRHEQPDNVEVLSMHEVVAKVLDRLDYMISDHQPIVIMPDEWPTAVGYAPWVEEIWANYISNAMKYGGKPPRIKLGADHYNGQIRFWIYDNGQGIPRAEQQKLFAPFVRLNDGGIEGHGLGLSIVKRIVHKLGGDVGVESLPNNNGSCFWFTLPMAEGVGQL